MTILDVIKKHGRPPLNTSVLTKEERECVVDHLRHDARHWAHMSVLTHDEKECREYCIAARTCLRQAILIDGGKNIDVL